MRKFVTVAIILAVGLFASYAFAGKGNAPHKRPVLPAMQLIKGLEANQERLQLSDEQVSQLRELGASLREQVREKMREMAQLMRKARERYRAGEDRERIKSSLHKEMQEVKARLHKLNEKAMMQIKQILTDEQLQKMRRYFAKRKEWLREKGGRKCKRHVNA